MVGFEIDSGFDGGNVRRLADGPGGTVRLAIMPDQGTGFFQWFYFRLAGARGARCRLEIVNAGESSYPAGWRDYRAVVSEDRETWLRVATAFDGRVLTLDHRLAGSTAWFAYFAPYSMELHHDLVARFQARPGICAIRLGATLDGQPLDLLEAGSESGRPCWIIGRQHPGETMAEWWMEGFLERLLDPRDETARALLGKARFHIVPNMNPDGSRRGHLRTNAAGTDLNRAWASPAMATSPEVHLVRARMAETGVGFCLDVHGDEGLPYVFIAGPEGIPSFSDALAGGLARFSGALAGADSRFQTEHGYPRTPPGKANLAICANHVAEAFGCLAMTLEQPFKDAANAPDPRHGWSPDHCRGLARSCIDALAATIDDLPGPREPRR